MQERAQEHMKEAGKMAEGLQAHVKQEAGKKEPFGIKPPAVYYTVIFLIVVIRCAIIGYRTPMWPIQYDNKEWLQDAFQMLMTSFYGLAFCVGGMIIVLEGDSGWLWGLGVAFFGAPVACVYLVQKAYQGPISFFKGASEGQKYC